MLLVKALIALVLGAIIYVILRPILAHFNIDVIWGYIVAVIVALGYFFAGPDTPWGRKP